MSDQNESSPIDSDNSNNKNSNKGLKSIPLKIDYRSGDNLLQEFYIPCLTESRHYDRAAGYFTSRSLVISARGLYGFIQNQGRMRLLTSYQFEEGDLETLRACASNQEENEVLESILEPEIPSDDFQSEMVQNRFKSLAWMIDEGYLDIRIAYLPQAKNGNVYDYHEKVGYFSDKFEHEVAFSGSINETEAGWKKNFESFDVFCSWRPGEQQRVDSKRDHFDHLWSNDHPDVIVRKLPQAIETGLKAYSPGTKNDLPDLDIYHDESFDESGPFIHSASSESDDDIELWSHQRKAIEWWTEHDYKGIFAMATGTGKTLTALRAARMEVDERLTVVVVPKNVLIDQWTEEIYDVLGTDAEILECSGRTDWRTEITKLVDAFRIGTDKLLKDRPRTVLITTPHTGTSEAFQKALEGIAPDRLQLIADEVHNYGAPTFKGIFDIDAGRRIGLSATPDRQWDESGTESIYNYFGGHDPFRFGTKEAIANGYLSKYDYHPIISDLAPYEYEDYRDISKEIQQIAAQLNTGDSKSESTQERYERLLRDRAKIKKKANSKPERFGELLENGVPTPTIIFCEDTEQLEEIEEMLEKHHPNHYGGYISARANEQAHALYDFREGHIDYLLAIDCLDEGLDVPDARSAILISSDRNKRQFIQRRGRVLRINEGKDKAVIYDMLVLPGVQAGYDDSESLKLIQQELERAKLLMAHAENRDESERELADELESYGKGFRALAYIDPTNI